MATEAAHLFVKVTADVDKASRNLGKIGSEADKTGGILKGAVGTALGFGAASVAMGGFGSAFGLVKGGAIDMNAELERSTLQFETLMGDSDKAKKHVEGLFDFAAKTPFETGPIIKASRIMETFGGSALNSKKNLTLFGDAAAAVSAPIEDIGFWSSRAYADIKAGRPFGEAAARLTELGVITPQTRSKLEDMQKAGKSGSEVWGAYQESLGRFSGAMDKQAGTLDGMLATFSDGVNMLLAKALRPLFDGLKGLVGGLNELMSSPAFNGAIDAVGRGIAAAFKLVGDAFGAVLKVLGPVLGAFASVFGALASGEDSAAGLGETVGGLLETFRDFGKTLQAAVYGAIEGVLKQIPAFGDAILGMATQAIDVVVANAPAFVDAILEFVQTGIDWVVNTGVPLAAEALGHFALAFIEWVGPAAEKLAGMLPVVAEKILGFLATNLPVIAGKLVEWAGAFVNWVAENVLPRLPGVLATVSTAVLRWLIGAIPVIVGKFVELGGAILGEVGKFLGQLPGTFGRTLGQVAASIGTWLGTVWTSLTTGAARWVTGLVDGIKGLPAKIGGVLGQIVTTIAGFAGKMAGAFVDLAVKAGKGFANGIVGLVEGAVNAVIRGINSFQIHFAGMDLGPLGTVAAVHWGGFNLPQVHLPRFEKGTLDTGSRSFAAILDPHEAVVPREHAARFRDWDSKGGGGGDTYVTVVVEGDYYGVDRNIDDLGERLAQHVRSSRPKRTLVAGPAGA